MVLRLVLVVLIGLAAVGVALVASVSFGTRTEPPALAAPPPPTKAMVIVAARPVQAGTLLKPEDMTGREIPLAEIPEEAVRDSPDARIDLQGAMVRRSMAAGEPIRLEGVLRPGDHGFLAAVLAPGTRAATVAVDAVSGTAGLIWPGDRIDLILTQALEEADMPPARRVVGERVLEAVRVIAVDRHLVQGVQPGGLGDPIRESNRTVTLEVTPEQATRVMVAARMGRLSLSVRAATTPPQDAVPETSQPIWSGDVSTALSRGGAPAGGSASGTTIRMFQGPGRVEEIRFR
jgi:pilus assembly protein CpaB